MGISTPTGQNSPRRPGECTVSGLQHLAAEAQISSLLLVELQRPLVIKFSLLDSHVTKAVTNCPLKEGC